MNRAYSQFEECHTDIVAVSFAEPSRLGPYRVELGLRHPLLCDPSRGAYRAFGLVRGSRLRVYGPRVLARYLWLLVRGRRLVRPQRDDDLYQLGGDALIGADGRLLALFESRDPADRPSVDELLSRLDGRGA